MKRRINILLFVLFIFANMAVLSFAQESNITAIGNQTTGRTTGNTSGTKKPKGNKKPRRAPHKRGQHKPKKDDTKKDDTKK